MSKRANTQGKGKSAQKYQNSYAFRHNPSSIKTAHILSLPNEGLCKECHKVVEWRKSFRKYKPLSTPKRCQGCDQKTVTRAYHVICDACNLKLEVCGKCRKPKSIVTPIDSIEMQQAEINKLNDAMCRMTESERRNFMRKMEDSDDEEYNSDGDLVKKKKKKKPKKREAPAETAEADSGSDLSSESDNEETEAAKRAVIMDKAAIDELTKVKITDPEVDDPADDEDKPLGARKRTEVELKPRGKKQDAPKEESESEEEEEDLEDSDDEDEDSQEEPRKEVPKTNSDQK